MSPSYTLQRDGSGSAHVDRAPTPLTSHVVGRGTRWIRAPSPPALRTDPDARPQRRRIRDGGKHERAEPAPQAGSVMHPVDDVGSRRCVATTPLDGVVNRRDDGYGNRLSAFVPSHFERLELD